MTQSDQRILDDLTHVATLDYLYKYTSAENAILLLEKSKLHFSSPLKFNDPFDCHPLLVKISDQFIYNTLNDNGYGFILNRKGFMKSPNYVNFVKNFGKTQTQEVKSKILPRMKITCFSEQKNNMLMWAHYAKDHSGICFEFDPKALIAHLAYETKSSNLPACLFLKVVHDNKRKNYVFESSDDPSPLILWVKTKSLEWEYESEIRLAFLKWDENLLSIHPGIISRIYLGSQISGQNEERIIRLCKANFPSAEIIKMGLSTDEFELTEQKI